MLKKEDILEIFQKLDLLDAKKRKQILSQGIILPEPDKKTSLWIESDNATDNNIEEIEAGK
jgi:hypothetical protein